MEPFAYNACRGRTRQRSCGHRESDSKETVMTLREPLTFAPVYKDYPWGGRRIETLLGRALPEGIVAESWEVSSREEGMSVADRGPLRGKTLAELHATYGPLLAGTAAPPGLFPLLIKILDVRERISLQVHPGDESAEGEPKTEMWYGLEGMQESRIFAGFEPGASPETVRAALQENRVEALLRPHRAHAHDAFFLPGGRVHAADAGCLFFEAQTNSNTTFRLHDWNRRGADGSTRPLHLEEGLRAIDWTDRGSVHSEPSLVSSDARGEQWSLVKSRHFRVDRLRLFGNWRLGHDARSMRILFPLDGAVLLRGDAFELHLPRARTALLPATLPACEVAPAETKSGGPAGAAGTQALLVSL